MLTDVQFRNADGRGRDPVQGGFMVNPTQSNSPSNNILLLTNLYNIMVKLLKVNHARS